MTQADLARQAQVSAAYISELEGGQGKRPSGEVLFRLANALDVTITELLGQDVRPADEEPDVEPSLLEFARSRRLPKSDIRMLASIRFRGEPPKTARRWQMIYDTIVMSRTLDETQG